MGFLRFLLATSVILSHVGYILGVGFVGGLLAVQTFFIISGFYMTLILKEKYVNRNGSYRLFITNRFLRIYPVYWFILVLTFITGVIFIPNYANTDTSSILSLVINYIYLPLKNIFLFTTIDFFVFEPRTYELYQVLVAWTLGLELVFYIIAPFVVKSKKILIPLFIFSILARLATAHVHVLYPMPYINRFLLTELCFFLAGACGYYVYSYIREMKIQRVLLIAMFAVFIAMTTFFKQATIFFGHENYFQWLYILAAALCIPFIFKLTNKSSIDQFFGNLSYPMYVSNSFVRLILVTVFGFSVYSVEYVPTQLVITFVLAFLLDRYISEPINRLRQKRVK